MKKILFRGRKDKIQAIVNFFPDIFSKKVLDVGCGDCYLKKSIKGDYTGIDKYGNPNIKQDISKGLPFDNESFDAVAGFDVLEHLDDIHFVFDELCRVSKKYVIITLPNMYEWRFRILFLFGKPLSGKYELLGQATLDRHRWVFSLEEARFFVRERAEKNGFDVSDEVFCYFKYNKIAPKVINKIGALFGRKFQNLFVYNYLVVLKRK
jgi:SAM-dependent methyltransferase